MSQAVKKEELLKAVADVLDEAIATYEQLEKMDMEPVADPSKKAPEVASADQAIAPAAAPAVEKPAGQEPPAQAAAMQKEEDKKDEKKEDDKDDEKDEDKKDEESDEKLMETYKSLVAKMEKRGLVKADVQPPIGNKSMEKSEAKSEANTEKTDDKSEEKIEALKKSFDERVEDLTKKIEGIAKAVESISKAPAAPRRGLSGATPLRKSEQETKPSFSKLEALDKLVEMRKSGDKRVDTALITRVEMGRLTQQDYERLNSILG